jgi:hypothetical protein
MYRILDPFPPARDSHQKPIFIKIPKFINALKKHYSAERTGRHLVAMAGSAGSGDHASVFPSPKVGQNSSVISSSRNELIITGFL